MSEDNSAPIIPTWFKVVSILALIWNLLGVFAFIDQMTMSPAAMEKLSDAELELYANIPIWATIAFACGVFGGMIGCLLLVLKQASAFYLLLISLVGVCVQMFHSFFISGMLEVYGPGVAIMPTMVMVIAFALVWLSKKAQSNHWIS